jgi:YjbE family integral membrane protein
VWAFIYSAATIIGINLILSADNGLVIAVAIRSLPPALRWRAVTAAAICDVTVRVTATFFAAQLLGLWFLRLAGGALILWIAIGLFRQGADNEQSGKNFVSFWSALWFIVAADATMSTDNVLAVAAVAGGNVPLLLAGLGFSIPCVLLGSTVLATLLDRYWWLVFAGAGLLGKIAGELLVTDRFSVYALHPSPFMQNCVQAACVIGVLSIGGFQLLRRRQGVPESGTS